MRIRRDQLCDSSGNVTHEIYLIEINSASILLEFFVLDCIELGLGVSICLDTLWIDTPLFRIGWGLL